MLLGRLQHAFKNPCQYFGGVYNGQSPNFGQSGSLRNKQSSMGKLTSVPSGGYPPYSFSIAQAAGAIASRNNLEGSSVNSPLNLAGGVTSYTLINGTSECFADMQLIISMVAAILSEGFLEGSATGLLQASGSMSGESYLTGDTRADSYIASVLSGYGSIDATERADGYISADITAIDVTTLTYDGIASAVWSEIMDKYQVDGTFGNALRVLHIQGTDLTMEQIVVYMLGMAKNKNWDAISMLARAYNDQGKNV
jgi:hypothetical protein